MPSSPQTLNLAVIGAGPAGLMAAETAAMHGIRVEVYDAMSSFGRKFLLAGKGGLNLTHSESFDTFLPRYGASRPFLEPILAGFGPDELRAWIKGLGVDTFVGSSGRVFPLEMKTSPLLRAWLLRLRETGVRFHARHRWQGWDEENRLLFATPSGIQRISATTVVLALGGGSWPRLGSDGAWVSLLESRGIRVEPLRPANCGFDVAWSPHFRERFQGDAVKPVSATVQHREALSDGRRGEFVVTANGVEGSLIYALSSLLRDEIEHRGKAVLQIDLAPDRDVRHLQAELAKARAGRSLANHLKRAVGLAGVKAALLREILPRDALDDPQRLATTIKTLPLCILAPRPLEEAISSAGGVAFEALDESLMLRSLPGIFCAGEMLDWEAPTGGYLLTACFATGRMAGYGVVRWITGRQDIAETTSHITS